MQTVPGLGCTWVEGCGTVPLGSAHVSRTITWTEDNATVSNSRKKGQSTCHIHSLTLLFNASRSCGLTSAGGWKNRRRNPFLCATPAINLTTNKLAWGCWVCYGGNRLLRGSLAFIPTESLVKLMLRVRALYIYHVLGLLQQCTLWTRPTRLHAAWLRLWLIKSQSYTFMFTVYVHCESPNSCVVATRTGSALVFSGNPAVVSWLFMSLVELPALAVCLCIWLCRLCLRRVCIFCLCRAYFAVRSWNAVVKLMKAFSSCTLSILKLLLAALLFLSATMFSTVHLFEFCLVELLPNIIYLLVSPWGALIIKRCKDLLEEN